MAPLFVKGSRVGVGPDQDRWLVVRKLGEGQFAEVYEVKDNHSKEDKRVRGHGSLCSACRRPHWRLVAAPDGDRRPRRVPTPRLPSSRAPTQYALKIEKRRDVKSVKQEHKVRAPSAGRWGPTAQAVLRRSPRQRTTSSRHAGRGPTPSRPMPEHGFVHRC